MQKLSFATARLCLRINSIWLRQCLVIETRCFYWCHDILTKPYLTHPPLYRTVAQLRAGWIFTRVSSEFHRETCTNPIWIILSFLFWWIDFRIFLQRVYWLPTKSKPSFFVFLISQAIGRLFRVEHLLAMESLQDIQKAIQGLLLMSWEDSVSDFGSWYGCQFLLLKPWSLMDFVFSSIWGLYLFSSWTTQHLLNDTLLLTLLSQAAKKNMSTKALTWNKSSCRSSTGRRCELRVWMKINVPIKRSEL